MRPVGVARLMGADHRTRPVLVAAFAIAALASGPAPAAWAHEQSFSYVDLVLGARSGDVRLTVHRRDAATAIGLATPDSLASASAVARLTLALERVIAPRLSIHSSGRELPVTWSGARPRPERRAVELIGRIEWARRPGQLTLSARIVPDDPLHETFANVYDRGRLLRQEVLTGSNPAFDMFTTGPEGLWAVFVTFVGSGVHHIFIGPDHILFIIGLLLLGGGVGRILKITSGFTLAHSITLALATLGIFQPPARVIEPLIALSIVYVGLDNLRSRTRWRSASDSGARKLMSPRQRWRYAPDSGANVRDGRTLVAFVFGLVHGFGFASVLTQLGLPRGALGTSLFAFNVGVEAGQAAIVLAAMPLLALLRSRSPRAAPYALTTASLGVVFAGGWWFVERVWLAG
jgi:HupE/UreJ protein